MKAIVITQPGGPEVLQLLDRPMPKAEAGDVLIRVHAAGINRPDLYQRKGNYPPPAGASPDIPGLEISGVIQEVGKQCIRFKVGDKVCAIVTGGGYAEFCAVPEGQCLPIPGTLTFAEAASLPETFFTVWSNVFERGKLVKGESMLVHGGAGGIGVTAIQLGTAFGVTVYTTAGSDEKCKFCESLGAAKAINYRTENFKEVIRKLTGGKGVNLVLDMIGGDYTPDNLDVLSDEGRLVLINFMKGDEATIKLGQIMRKRLTITGSTLRPRSVQFKSELAHQVEKNVWPWLESGKIKPVVHQIFPLEKASEAHALMESSAHSGKLVLLTNA